MRKLLGLLLAVIVFTLGGTAIASAASITLTPTSGNPGTTVSVSGSKFQKRSQGTIAFAGSQVATFTTNNGGGFTKSFTVPSTASAGSKTVQATAGSTSASAPFTVNAVTPPPPPPTNAVHVSGRSLVDASGAVVCSPTAPCKGFNMHVVPWAQSDFDAMAAKGAKIARIVVRWDNFEPTQGQVDATRLAALDTTIDRLAAANMYAIVDFHLLSGAYPAYTTGIASEEQRYVTYGKFLTQFLAARYANKPNVLGMGLNEPPISDNTIRSGPNNTTYIEGVQQNMVTWMREKAPQWIAFIGYGWAQASPLPGDGGITSRVRTDLTPAPFNFTNAVLDFHDYQLSDVNAGNGISDARQWNAMAWFKYQGGPGLGIDEFNPYVSSAGVIESQRQWHLPYKTFSIQKNIPLMIGEWGVTNTQGNEAAIAADKKARFTDDGAAIQMWWIYNVSYQNGADPWAARPGGIWRDAVTGWL